MKRILISLIAIASFVVTNSMHAGLLKLSQAMKTRQGDGNNTATIYNSGGGVLQARIILNNGTTQSLRIMPMTKQTVNLGNACVQSIQLTSSDLRTRKPNTISYAPQARICSADLTVGIINGKPVIRAVYSKVPSEILSKISAQIAESKAALPIPAVPISQK